MAKQVVYAQKAGGERASRNDALPVDLQEILDQRRAAFAAHAGALAVLSDRYFQDPKQFLNMEIGGTSC